MADGMLGTQDRDMARMYQQVASAVNQYHGNPAMFTEDQVKQLKAAADSLGIAMSVSFSPGRAFKKGLYELGEGLTFGFLPNRLDPGSMNTGEDIAGGIGGLLGLAMPVGAGLKVGSMGLKGARQLAAGAGLGKRGIAGFIGPMHNPAARGMATVSAAQRNVLTTSTGLFKALSKIKNNRVRNQLMNLASKLNEAALSPSVVKAANWASTANIPLTRFNAIRGLGVGGALMSRDMLGESAPEAMEFEQ